MAQDDPTTDWLPIPVPDVAQYDPTSDNSERKEVLEEVAFRPAPMDPAGASSCLVAGDPKLRALAAMALGQLDARTAVGPLRRALEDSDWEVRLQAANALGRLKSREAWVDLKPLLSHPPPVVAAAAARAIGQGGAREAEPDLRELLEEGGILRCAAARALTDLGAEDGALQAG